MAHRLHSTSNTFSHLRCESERIVSQLFARSHIHLLQRIRNVIQFCVHVRESYARWQSLTSQDHNKLFIWWFEASTTRYTVCGLYREKWLFVTRVNNVWRSTSRVLVNVYTHKHMHKRLFVMGTSRESTTNEMNENKHFEIMRTKYNRRYTIQLRLFASIPFYRPTWCTRLCSFFSFRWHQPNIHMRTTHNFGFLFIPSASAITIVRDYLTIYVNDVAQTQHKLCLFLILADKCLEQFTSTMSYLYVCVCRPMSCYNFFFFQFL